MKTQALLGTVVLALVAASSAALALQDKGAPGGQPRPASADPKMAKWDEFAKPGTAHRVLDARVGKWNCAVKMIMEPGAAPQESTGTSEVKWILDGRFIQETVTGEFMGQEFQGLGATGYDNLKKKYVTSWVDNMGTGIMNAEGTYDAATKSFNFSGDCPDPMAGKYVKSRSVDKNVDADHWTMQMYKFGPDGKEFLAGQIDYTRAK